MTDNERPIQKEHPDLYRRSIQGGYWIFAIRAATQALGFVKSIIVFNFLFKENLELIIVANLLLAVLNTSTESGFRAALVQKKDDIKDYLDTAWVIDILRGTLLFTAIFLIAPWFASLKVAPEDLPLAIGVIRAMGACFLISAFQNIGVIYFQKELEFHKTFWLKIAGTITDIVLSIVLVLTLQSVWGYIIARLAAAVVRLAMSYLMCPYRPGLHFVPEKARELWRFGKWLFGAKIIGYLLNEGDDWFVWFYLGGVPLKLYRYAYRFSQTPNTHFAGMISGVSFPAYSKIQNDVDRLRNAHLKVLQSTAMISIPMSFLIFIIGPDFVHLFLVSESHDMIPVIQILAIVGLIQSLGSSFWALYVSLGKPYYALFSQCTRLAILAIIIYPLTLHLGIIGTAISVVLALVIVFPFGFYIGCRLLKCSPWIMAKPLLFCFLAAVIMIVPISLLKTFVIVDVTIPLFFILAFAASVLYFVVLLIIDAYFKLGYRDILTEQIKVIKQRLKGRK